MTMTKRQEGEGAEDHAAGGLILHLGGPAYSRRSRVAQREVRRLAK